MKWSNELEIVRAKFEKIGQAVHKHMYECYLEERFPMQAWEALANNDFMSATIRLGHRRGIEWLAAAIHGFSFGSQDGAFNIATIVHSSMGVYTLNEYANIKAKQKYLLNASSGKSIIAFCVTEAENSGTDAFRPQCRIKNSASGTFLNGEKWHITNAPHASLLMVWAHDEDTKDLVCVLVEPNFSGVNVLDKLHPCGARTSPVAPIIFDNVFIPAENIIRFKNGAAELNKILIGERILSAFPQLGLMDASIKKALGFIKERKVQGKRLLEYQYKQGELSEAQMLQYMVVTCAKVTLDQYVAGDDSKLESSVLKVKAIEYTSTAIRHCMHACGSYGLQDEAQFSMFLNDAFVTTVGGGTVEAHRMVVLREMLKKHRETTPLFIGGEKPWMDGMKNKMVMGKSYACVVN